MMIAPSQLTLLVALLMFNASLHNVDAQDTVKHHNIRIGTTSSIQEDMMDKSTTRILAHKDKDEDKDPLIAEIKPIKDCDYEDLDGWVSIEYDDDEMIIDYHITDGPERCDSCKMAIYDGKSCDDLDDPYYDTDDNPWTVDDTSYITNVSGRSAGFFKVDNGYSYRKNSCQFIVIFDEDDHKRNRDEDDDDEKKHKKDEDDDDDDKKKHKKDDDDDRRRLRSQSSSSSSRSRSLRKDKAKMIGCGQLIPEDKNDSYC